jgi:hypothetical protein
VEHSTLLNAALSIIDAALWRVTMQELLIVNPAKRPKKRKAASPAQKRARAAFAAKYGKKRAAPKRRTTRKSTTKAIVMANPRKRRATARKTTRRYKRNPTSISIRSVTARPMALLKPAFTGALGAIGVNTVLSALPLPDMLTQGRVRYLTQGAAAIGLGMIAQKLGVSGATASKMAEGSLTVTLYQAITDIARGAGVNLGKMRGLGYYTPARRVGFNSAPNRGMNTARLNAYVTGNGSVPPRGGMGMYVTGSGAGTPATATAGRR